jgi:oxygen-independent coproporphyrinogen-3 oxidase
VVDRYLDRLERQIAIVIESIGTTPRVAERHWGGGTLNFLDDRQLTRLASIRRRAFPIDARTECSIEADPRLVPRSQRDTLRALGFRRISFGVHDLDPAVQVAIGRIQPEALVREVVFQSRGAGFSGINRDLRFGLPEQTPGSFSRTIDVALSLSPDRVACFKSPHLPWMHAYQKRVDEAALPLGAARLALFRDAVTRLVRVGDDWLGIDHFALPDDPRSLAAHAGRLHRSFMGYTTRVGENLLGLGPSAISEMNGWYVQNSPERDGWQCDIDDGHLSLARGHVRSPHDELRAAAITHLMCNAELPCDLFTGDMFGLVDRFGASAADGLVEDWWSSRVSASW